MSIQRYDIRAERHDYMTSDGPFVLYADHVAAVEAAYKLGAAAAFGIEREQAIRDCMDVCGAVMTWPVEGAEHPKSALEMRTEIYFALRALLDGAK